MTAEQLLKDRKATTEEATLLYDSLGPVDFQFMKGRWKGFEIITGHKIEGLLEHSGWYGKLFEDEENVHPLLISTLNKKGLFAINPLLVPLGINFPKHPILKTMMAILKPIIKTKKSKARMRMIEYRGKLSGTMVYDEKKINDHFAKIDDNTMLGLMDWKGSDRPYFFVLERDNTPYKLEL